MRRKTTVIEAVRRGWISLDELTRRYSLSIDEFVAWERSESTMFLVHEPLDFIFPTRRACAGYEGRAPVTRVSPAAASAAVAAFAQLASASPATQNAQFLMEADHVRAPRNTNVG